MYFCGNIVEKSAIKPFVLSPHVTIFVYENGPSSIFGKATTALNSSETGVCYLSYYFNSKRPSCKYNSVVSFRLTVQYLYIFILF